MPSKLLGCIGFFFFVQGCTEKWPFPKLCSLLLLKNWCIDVSNGELESAQTWHNCSSIPCFQNSARDFWYSVSFPFFYRLFAFSQKKKNTFTFIQHQLLRAISWKRNKNSKKKTLALVCRSRLLLHISKIKTCLWCSLIEINLLADIVFWTHFRIFFQNFFQRYLIFFWFVWFTSRSASKWEKNASKCAHKPLNSPLSPAVTISGTVCNYQFFFFFLSNPKYIMDLNGEGVGLRTDWKKILKTTLTRAVLRTARSEPVKIRRSSHQACFMHPAKRAVTIITWPCTSNHSWSQIRLERGRMAKHTTVFGKRGSKALPFFDFFLIFEIGMWFLQPIWSHTNVNGL